MKNPLHTLWKKFNSYFSPRQFYEPGGYVEIWHIAWPLIVLSASNTIMMITNRVFLAQSSQEEIAAAMPAGQMFFTLMAFFLITTSFTATVVAQYHGARNKVGCVRACWNGFYFGSMVAAFLAFLLPAGGSWIIMHNGHSPLIAQYEAEYFIAMAPCAGLTCMETAFLSFFTGRGKTTLVAVIKIIGCFICVPLNYLLIFGVGSIPPLGILGAGFANSLANTCTFLIAAGAFLLVDQTHFPTRKHNSLHWEFWQKLLYFGTPAGLQTFCRNAAFAIVVMMIGRLGDVALAATSIALSINMIGNMPMIGLMDATSVITGQYIGKGRLKVAERIAGRSWRILILWMSGIALIYLFAPDFLISLFGSKAESSSINSLEVSEQIRMILRFAVIFNLFDATRFITMGSLRGAGDTKVPLYIGVSTAWFIQLAGTIVLVYWLNGTLAQVWILLTFYIAADAALMLWRRRTGAWKHIKVIS